MMSLPSNTFTKKKNKNPPLSQPSQAYYFLICIPSNPSPLLNGTHNFILITIKKHDSGKKIKLIYKKKKQEKKNKFNFLCKENKHKTTQQQNQKQ